MKSIAIRETVIQKGLHNDYLKVIRDEGLDTIKMALAVNVKDTSNIVSADGGLVDSYIRAIDQVHTVGMKVLPYVGTAWDQELWRNNPAMHDFTEKYCRRLQDAGAEYVATASEPMFKVKGQFQNWIRDEIRAMKVHFRGEIIAQGNNRGGLLPNGKDDWSSLTGMEWIPDAHGADAICFHFYRPMGFTHGSLLDDWFKEPAQVNSVYPGYDGYNANKLLEKMKLYSDSHAASASSHLPLYCTEFGAPNAKEHLGRWPYIRDMWKAVATLTNGGAFFVWGAASQGWFDMSTPDGKDFQMGWKNFIRPHLTDPLPIGGQPTPIPPVTEPIDLQPIHDKLDKLISVVGAMGPRLKNVEGEVNDISSRIDAAGIGLRKN